MSSQFKNKKTKIKAYLCLFLPFVKAFIQLKKET